MPASRSNLDGLLVEIVKATSETRANTRTIIQMMLAQQAPPSSQRSTLVTTATSIGIKILIGRILAWVLYLGTPIMLWMTAWAWHRIGPWWRLVWGYG